MFPKPKFLCNDLVFASGFSPEAFLTWLVAELEFEIFQILNQ
jgi:hypothetical protein